jgi:sterol desaturase/sphingolipid hydroxylase (fatty acid hydroxylase superfamily)
LPYLIAPAIAPLQVADLSGLGLWGAALAMLVYQLLGYVYHRGMHASNTLFRVMHQTHHSAERLDTASAFFFGPLDAVGWTLVSSVALTLFGITPEATVAFVLSGTFLAVFQHANLRTPRWLGYFIQRPESHSHHHGRGIHRNNYADLPIIDLMFGTFQNPEDFAPATGFYDGASARVLDLLRFADVTRRPSSASAERVSEGAEAAPVLSRRQPDLAPEQPREEGGVLVPDTLR